MLLVNQGREMEVMSDVIQAQNEVFQVQSTLLLKVERKQARERRRLDAVERRMDPVGRTMGNPILIEDDEDEVTLVEAPGVIQQLIPINDTDDGSD